mgnify:CR=1 FL=1|jgi:DNA polymerase III alpha subunit (gram-positive type)
MKEVVAVDVETGGLDPGEHALLSVGLYHPDEDLEVEMSAQPQKIVTDKALEINGFDRGRVHEGQDLYQAESEVKEFLDGFDKPVFVAHNASYDKAFLTEYFDIQSFEYPFIDTLSVAKLFRQAGMHHPGRLEDLHRKACDGDEGEYHSALYDAKAAYEVYEYFKKKVRSFEGDT